MSKTVTTKLDRIRKYARKTLGNNATPAEVFDTSVEVAKAMCEDNQSACQQCVNQKLEDIKNGIEDIKKDLGMNGR